MADTRWFHETLNTSGHKTIHPTADVLDALKQDYPIEASVADLIDNSIDAEATTVVVRLFERSNRIIGLCIADDGNGMGERQIDEAMQFAKKRSYTSKDLGMFGLGLKTASLSQADVLTVISRAPGQEPVGRRWSETGIKLADWRCDVIAPADARAEFGLDWGRLGKLRKGTIVRWDKVRDFERLPDSEVSKYVSRLRATISRHVGLKLHRILTRKQIQVVLDTIDVDTGEMGLEMVVAPLNPFPASTGRKGYPRMFVVKIPDHGTLDFRAHIWPKKSPEPGFKLETGKSAEHQGFYFYRRDRLVQEGGWNGARASAEPHLSLARVEIDIPDNLANYFRVHSTKRGVDVPRSFTAALEAARAKDDPSVTFANYLAAAEETYRTRGEQGEKPILAPGPGIPAPVRIALEKEQTPFKRGRGMKLKWGRVIGKKFFDFDREADEVILNDRYRAALLAGRKASGADLPVIRVLLYFLLAPTLERTRDSVAESGRLRAIQSALMAAAKLEADKE